MSTKNHSGDKRGGFVPLGDIAGAVDLPNGRALTTATPKALHHFTRLDQIDQLVDASETDADLGFGSQLRYIRRNGPYTLAMTAGVNKNCPTATCRVCSWRGSAPRRYGRKTANSSLGVRWPTSCGVWVFTTMAAPCGGGYGTRCSGSFVPMWNWSTRTRTDRRVMGEQDRAWREVLSRSHHQPDPARPEHPQGGGSRLDAFDAVRIDCLNGDKYKTGKVSPDGLPDPSIFSTESDPVGIQAGTAIVTLVRKADNLIEAKHPALYRVLLAAMTSSDKSYLAYMSARLLELRRVLKPTGSLYLHCDPHNYSGIPAPTRRTMRTAISQFSHARNYTRMSIAMAAIAIMIAPSAAGAQGAGISGIVTDTTGGVLPGVTVEVRDAAGGVQTAFTDGTGMYSVTLQPGTYNVTITLPGFNVVTREVTVAAGTMVTVDAELGIAFTETVAVVGTRTEPRSVTASPVPIDVIRAQDFVSQGDVDLTNQLRTVVPSFNVNTQPISDAATIVRPASLRNMAPDHTLILVNGKRRHRAAVIAWLGNGIADGAQGPDLSSIPSIALRQVEVLRDGAAAQYGSDAIAGVINFELKNARSGGSVEFRTGQFYDGNDGDPSTCGPLGRSCNAIGGRAQGFTFAGNAGLPLGPEGFLNLSLEYGGTQPTNRAVQDGGTLKVIDGGNSNVRDTSRAWGTPRVDDDLKVFASFGTGGERAEFYGHANYASKKVTGGFYFRNPNNRGNVYSVDGGETLLVGDVLMANGMGSANCPTVNIVNGTPDPAAFAAVRDNPNCFTFHEPFAGAPDGFPGGFTPQFGGDLRDFSVVAGVRGSTMTGLNWDVSVNQGQNQVQTFIFDTVNASLGPDSPTRFEPNLLEQTETTFNADLSYAASDMINVAGGAEWRNEQYQLGAGDPASWAIGPYGEQGFSSASNGYNGTRPENAGIWDRANVAAYGDVDVHGVDNEWSLGAAVRIEDFYDSFGTTMNSKLSGRYAFTDAFAVRAGVSSGFRAPTPGQQNVLNVTTEFDYEIQDLINNGTIPSTSPVAALRNGKPLQPEQAINYSAGTVVDSGTFTFTADYFRINVDDRLTITRNYNLSPDEKTTLIAAGIAEAGNLAAFRFFVNDFSTRTQGVDIVSTWTPLAIGGRTTISGVYNFTDTAVTKFSQEHFDADRVTSLTLGLPRTRWNIGVNQTENNWTLMARLHYYGAYWDREDARAELGNAMSYLYPLYSGKPLVDLEVGFPLNDVTLSVGAQNIFNTYPAENPGAVAGVGNRYGQFGPFGFNGGYYYMRLNYGWGSGML